MPAAELRRETSGVGPGRVARGRRRRRRRSLIAGGVVAGLLIALVGADFAVYGARVHPGVEVAGESLGGRSVEEARTALAGIAEDLRRRPIRFSWEGQTFVATAGELGWRPDLGATARAAFEVGKAGTLWSDTWARTAAWFRPASVGWAHAWDEASLEAAVVDWEETVAVAPTEGRIEFVGTEVTTSDPVPGRAVDRSAVEALAAGVLDGRSVRRVPLPVVEVEPLTTAGDVRLAAAEVEALISGPVSIRLGTLRVELSAEELAGAAAVTLLGEGEDAQLTVGFDPAEVGALLAPYREDVETSPVPARFVTRGSRVFIEPSVPGRVVAPRLAARRLLAIAQGPGRSGRVHLGRQPAEFTTADARALGIVEEVSSFTTFHAAGEPRVTNIHRAADLLDGAIAMPGEAFSMNGYLGNRTADRGFVEAPVIYDGEFTTDVGGGVSQLATTLFNAVFFGGYPILEYQAHSVYISRYPQGREATVSWPKPDLVFRNDTRTAFLIKTSYTDSSITVRIFGDRHGRSVTATDPVVIGSGPTGYTVQVQRIVERGGVERRRDTFTTFYRTQ